MKTLANIILIQFMVFGFSICSYAQERVPTTLLTLEQAISLALKANRTILSSANGVENQQLSITAAESEFDLKVFPKANAGVSDYYKEAAGGVSLEKKFEYGPKATVSPGVGWTKTGGTIAEIGVGLEIPLLRGFGRDANLDRVRSSEYSLRSSERSFYLNQVNIVLDTVAAVYDIIKQDNLLRLYQHQTERFKAHADAARVKENVGLASPMDIYRAEIKLKGSEEALVRSQEAFQDAKDRLKLILSFPMDTPIHVSAPLNYQPVRMNVKEAVSIALDNRVELEQAEDDIEEAKRTSGVAKNRLLPELNLAMDYRKSNFFDPLSRTAYDDEDRWSISLVSRTDWARTSEKVAFQQSLINVRTINLQLEEKRDEIVRQVRRQLEALIKDEKGIHIKKEQIDQAEGQLALAQIKFDHQMADNFDIIEAETELQNSKANLLNSETDYILGTYRMRAILGTLIER